ARRCCPAPAPPPPPAARWRACTSPRAPPRRPLPPERASPPPGRPDRNRGSRARKSPTTAHRAPWTVPNRRSSRGTDRSPHEHATYIFDYVPFTESRVSRVPIRGSTPLVFSVSPHATPPGRAGGGGGANRPHDHTRRHGARRQ